MSEHDAARFRKQAEEARQHAERAISPLDKEAWLRVAAEWIKLAESAVGGQGFGGLFHVGPSLAMSSVGTFDTRNVR
jgi:hypothetical protein